MIFLISSLFYTRFQGEKHVHRSAFSLLEMHQILDYYSWNNYNIVRN